MLQGKKQLPTTVSPAYSLIGLEVSDLDSNDFYVLAEVIPQKKMPVTVDDMVTPEDLAKWPYLAKVHVPSIKANVKWSTELHLFGTVSSPSSASDALYKAQGASTRSLPDDTGFYQIF